MSAPRSSTAAAAATPQQQQQQPTRSTVSVMNPPLPSRTNTKPSSNGTSGSVASARPTSSSVTAGLNPRPAPTVTVPSNTNRPIDTPAVLERSASFTPPPATPTSYSNSASDQFSASMQVQPRPATAQGAAPTIGRSLSRNSSHNDLRSMGGASPSPSILSSINPSDPNVHMSRRGDLYLNLNSQTVYGVPNSKHPLGVAQRSNIPQWGPPIYPPPPQSQPPSNSLASLYTKPAPPPPPVPFAPPPRPPQNIADDPEFFERYKHVWTTFHAVHDGIERPAVQSLLPPRVFWYNKRMLDIGCGAGKMCRQFRVAHAQLVIGLDCSYRMISAAEAREYAEQSDRASGNTSGIGAALKRFFRTTLTEAELTEKIQRERGAMQAKRDSTKLQTEDAARKNAAQVTYLAQATADAEKERQRLIRFDSSGQDPDAAEHHAMAKENQSFFKKLQNAAKEHLRPSQEAASYKEEAEAKKAMREYEERASAAQSSMTINISLPPQSDEESRIGASRANSVASSPMASPANADGSAPASAAASDSGPFIPVKYIHSSIEAWEPSPGTSFHLITCCMTMQFIWDLQAFAKKVYSLLTPNGLFVCSVDHPVSTCAWGIHPIVIKDDPRQPDVISYFPLDQYHEQGERKAKYYIEGVVKYHRRIDTYINTFLAAGLQLEKICEPRASKEMEAEHPELKTWRRKPIFLCMRFKKPIQNITGGDWI